MQALISEAHPHTHNHCIIPAPNILIRSESFPELPVTSWDATHLHSTARCCRKTL